MSDDLDRMADRDASFAWYCNGVTKANARCRRYAKYKGQCWQHYDEGRRSAGRELCTTLHRLGFRCTQPLGHEGAHDTDKLAP